MKNKISAIESDDVLTVAAGATSTCVPDVSCTGWCCMPCVYMNAAKASVYPRYISAIIVGGEGKRVEVLPSSVGLFFISVVVVDEEKVLSMRIGIGGDLSLLFISSCFRFVFAIVRIVDSVWPNGNSMCHPPLSVVTLCSVLLEVVLKTAAAIAAAAAAVCTRERLILPTPCVLLFCSRSLVLFVGWCYLE